MAIPKCLSFWHLKKIHKGKKKWKRKRKGERNKRKNTTHRRKKKLKARYGIWAELCWVPTSDSWAGWNIKRQLTQIPLGCLVVLESYGLERFGVEENKIWVCQCNFIIWHHFANLGLGLLDLDHFREHLNYQPWGTLQWNHILKRGWMSRGRSEELNRTKLPKKKW